MIQTPKPATLKRYGLSEEEWRKMADAQGHACYVCRRVPKTGRLVIDHEHVKLWKKMPPEKRKIYVRGLLCWTCNATFLGRGITIERSRNVTRYLEEYELRKIQLLNGY